MVRRFLPIILISILLLPAQAGMIMRGSGGAAAVEVARLDSPSGSGDVQTKSYSVSAGTNRLLVVCNIKEGGSYPTTVTYGDGSGDSSLTLQAQYGDTTAGYVEIWTGDEALIAAADGTTITVDGGTATNRVIFAASYENVDQTTPVPEENGAYSHAGAGSTDPITTSITAGDGSAVVSCSYNGSAGNTVSWGGDLTEQGSEISGTSNTGSIADGLFSTGQSVTASADWTSVSNQGVAAIEIAPGS